MDEKSLLTELETLAGRLGMVVRYESLKVEGSRHAGGFCRVRGKDLVIIQKKATTRDKIDVLAKALKKCDLRHLYLLPSVREILGDDDEARVIE